MLRGHLPVFHDLLDLGSFVLKPDFHLGGGTKAHVTGTLRGHPCLTQGSDWRLVPPRRPGPGVSQQLEAYGLEGLGLRQRPDREPQRAPKQDLRDLAAARTQLIACVVFCLGWGRGEGTRVHCSVHAHVGQRSAAKVKQWPEPRVSGSWSRLGAHEFMEVKNLSPNPPPDSVHQLLISESGQNLPAALGGDSSILYSSIGVTVGVKGKGPSREYLVVQQCPPPHVPQAAAAQSSASAGSDPSAFPGPRPGHQRSLRPKTKERPPGPPLRERLCVTQSTRQFPKAARET